MCVAPHTGVRSSAQAVPVSSELPRVAGEKAPRWRCLRRHAPSTWEVGFGEAVSRFLSAPLPGERIIYLSDRTRNLPPLRTTRSGPLLGSLFDLAPDGVFRAAVLARGAVGSYPTFSPLPRLPGAVCFLWHCPSASLATPPPACIPAGWPGYAASRPVVFGLSSLSKTRERFSASPKPSATLGRSNRESKRGLRGLRRPFTQAGRQQSHAHPAVDDAAGSGTGTFKGIFKS